MASAHRGSRSAFTALAAPKSHELGAGTANFDSSLADVGDYRDRRPLASDIWKRRIARCERQLGRPGSLSRRPKLFRRRLRLSVPIAFRSMQASQYTIHTRELIPC